MQEQEVSRNRNRRNRKIIKGSLRVLEQEIGKTGKARWQIQEPEVIRYRNRRAGKLLREVFECWSRK
jgi:hypothetical protein